MAIPSTMHPPATSTAGPSLLQRAWRKFRRRWHWRASAVATPGSRW